MSAQDSHYAQVIEPDANQTGASSPAPAGTARIGAELRAVRERLGWKRAEVAAELRIREPYLEAIENGDLEALPGPAYQIGFVRSYAQALGLDGEEILRRFRAEGLGASKKPELSFLAPVPDRAVPSGAIVLLGVVLLLAGYGLWFLHTESDRTMAASIPSVPAELAPLAVPPALPAPKPAAPALAKNGAQVTPATVGSGTALAAAAPAPGLAAAASGKTPPAPQPAAPGVSTPAPATQGETILATADSWVEVKDASGNILFSRLMHQGDSWPVPDMPGLSLTAGNAGGTEIADNGAAGQPLGAAGAVVRNYALTQGGAAAASAPSAGAAASPPVVASPATTATPQAVQNSAKGTN
jgi:cytoskeleton protein RodZ